MGSEALESGQVLPVVTCHIAWPRGAVIAFCMARQPLIHRRFSQILSEDQ